MQGKSIKPVEQSDGHFCIAEDSRPFAERQIGGDDDRSSLVEPADEVEQQLSASLSERKIATAPRAFDHARA
ncbi:hypothetical protein IL59_0211365 [Brucella suis bv. 4 str. 40]|nr:hypothetical protein IL59_0211365 [Brucella suis bv. 4 str. 40]